ncbi:dGTPase [Lentisphaerota bacterium ZTH]|nr:dGTPase [Lentisphaerota bacterium]WET06187.1 dGTPase [Lentisphaerota bacterium ZTH]
MLENFLDPERRKKTSVTGRSNLEEFYSDRSRIIYSKPFRRLQRKTQVFSWEDDTAVRSRLAHTLEVADIGRLIAAKISHEMKKRNPNFSCSESIVTVVENACLLHDLGNPPFGHFGEAAIRDWFKKNCLEILKEKCFSDDDRKRFENKYLPDFTSFDGNPQGFRLVTGLCWDREDHYGLNLTFPTLKAFLKYTRAPSEKEETAIHGKKPGYFESERSVIEEIYQKEGKIKRHPLAYIMEAADDIAYCTSDICDGLEKKIITPSECLKNLIDTYQKKFNNDFSLINIDNIKNKPFLNKSDFIYTVIVHFTRKMIYFAAKNFVENIKSIINGQFKSLIPDDSEEYQVLETFKEVTRKSIYKTEEVEKIELSGYALVYKMLDYNKPLLLCEVDVFYKLLEGERVSKRELERRLVDILPSRYKKYYQHQIKNDDRIEEIFHRFHLIVDSIAGMTDDHALEIGNAYRGIEFR